MSDAVWLALLAAIPPTVLAFAALRAARGAKATGEDVQTKVAKLSVDVDGRLTQLLKVTEASASAEGQLTGRAGLLAEQDQAKPPESLT